MHADPSSTETPLNFFHTRYDNAGNRTLKTTITDAGTVTDQSTSINDLNQIITRVVNGVTWNYVYDLDGNLIEKNNGSALGNEKWQYTWNEDNRLTHVTRGVWVSGPVLSNILTVSYQYDIAGRLLRRVSGSTVTTFEWDGWVPIGETTGSVVTRWNAPEGLLLSFERGGSVYQCHSDALGSMRAVTDSSGAVVARYDYDAWGNLLPGGSDNVPGVLLYRFVGALGCRLDQDTGFVYMRNRWYDPQLGRFISRDPIGLRGGENRYAYAHNNPVNLVDHHGTFPWALLGLGLSTAAADYAHGMNLLSTADQQGLQLAIDAIGKVPGYSKTGSDLRQMLDRGEIGRLDPMKDIFGGGLYGFTEPFVDFDMLYISPELLDDRDCPRRLVRLATTLFHESRHQKQKNKDRDFLFRQGLNAYVFGDKTAERLLEGPAYAQEHQFLSDWTASIPKSSPLQPHIQNRLAQTGARLNQYNVTRGSLGSYYY